jgi:hypothetical protein
MMWAMLRMAPLLGGISALVDMKKCWLLVLINNWRRYGPP